MKKVLSLLIIAILALLIVGCEVDTDNEQDIPAGALPVFAGVSDLELIEGDHFNPLEGITATDKDGVDITDAIVVFGVEAMGLYFSQAVNLGTFTLTYQVIDFEGRVAQRNRVIRVVEATEPVVPGLEECGNPIIGDYVITWCDEFTGEGPNVNAFGVDLDKWEFQLGTGTAFGLIGWGNNEAQYYREENARVEDGRLIIEARLESFGGRNYTSTRMRTEPHFSQLYGRFEAKIKLPVGNGLWPAFWMMPQDNVYGGWAASGEIDIMEARGRQPDRSIAALHFGGSWPNNTHTHATYHFPPGQSIADFNVYAIEWEEGIIRWYVNDNLIKTSTNWFTQGHAFPAPFDQEFHMILNLAIGGTFDGGNLPPDSLFNNPVLMEVEYVRVYQRVEQE